MRSEDRSTYARAVWDTFRAKAKTQRESMSSTEYYVLSKWMDKSIPLPVVLRAIEEFNGTPRVLTALETPVDKAYSYWFQAIGGVDEEAGSNASR